MPGCGHWSRQVTPVRPPDYRASTPCWFRLPGLSRSRGGNGRPTVEWAKIASIASLKLEVLRPARLEPRDYLFMEAAALPKLLHRRHIWRSTVPTEKRLKNWPHRRRVLATRSMFGFLTCKRRSYGPPARKWRARSKMYWRGEPVRCCSIPPRRPKQRLGSPRFWPESCVAIRV